MHINYLIFFEFRKCLAWTYIPYSEFYNSFFVDKFLKVKLKSSQYFGMYLLKMNEELFELRKHSMQLSIMKLIYVILQNLNEWF